MYSLPAPRLRPAVSALTWSFVGIGGQGITRLVAVLVLVRFIPPDAFGSFALATAVVGFIPITAYTALRLSLVRRYCASSDSAGTTLAVSLALGALGAGVILALSDPLGHGLGVAQTGTLLKVLCCVLVLDAAAVVPESALIARGRFKALGVIEVIAAATGSAALAIVVAWLFDGTVWALVFGAIAQSTIRCVLAWAVAERIVLKFTWSELRLLFGFSSGLFLNHVGNYVALQADTFVVGRTLGATTLGLYGRAYQLMAVPATVLGGVIDRVMYPLLCRAREHKRFFRRELLRTFQTLALVLLPFTACLFLASEELVLVLLGPAWISATAPFRILLLALYLRASYKVGDCALRATGHVYNAAFRQWLYAGGVFFGAAIGTNWGIEGVAIGIVAAIAFNWFSVVRLAARNVGATGRMLLSAHVPAILSTAVVATVALLLISAVKTHWDTPLATIVCAVSVFMSMIAVLLVRGALWRALWARAGKPTTG